MSARRSRIARGASVAVHALDRRATGPPGRASLWCRGSPARSARHALGAVDETGCGDPTHRRQPPSRAGPAHPTGRALPSTAHVACDILRLPAHDMPDAVAGLASNLRGGTTGNRVRRARGETHTPCTPRPDRCRPSPGDHTIAASPPPNVCPAWESYWD